MLSWRIGSCTFRSLLSAEMLEVLPICTSDFKPFCTDIRGGLIQGSGHYIPEEQPRPLRVK